MSSEPLPDADRARAADDLRGVPGWRRTGLVLGWGAVGCAGAALLTWLPDREDPGAVSAVLALAALIAALLAPAFLRRAWSVPAVADDPAVVRARGWSDVVIYAWAAALLLRLVFETLLGLGGIWLDVVRGVLGVLVVVSYVGMLVLATRWRPAPSTRRDQL